MNCCRLKALIKGWAAVWRSGTLLPLCLCSDCQSSCMTDCFMLTGFSNNSDQSESFSLADTVSHGLPLTVENKTLTLCLSPVMASQLVQLFGPADTGLTTMNIHYDLFSAVVWTRWHRSHNNEYSLWFVHCICLDPLTQVSQQWIFIMICSLQFSGPADTCLKPMNIHYDLFIAICLLIQVSHQCIFIICISVVAFICLF